MQKLQESGIKKIYKYTDLTSINPDLNIRKISFLTSDSLEIDFDDDYTGIFLKDGKIEAYETNCRIFFDNHIKEYVYDGYSMSGIIKCIFNIKYYTK